MWGPQSEELAPQLTDLDCLQRLRAGSHPPQLVQPGLGHSLQTLDLQKDRCPR